MSDSLADRLWVRLPDAVRRWVLTPGMILSDGDYLRAWPGAALVAPGAALGLGTILALTLRGFELGPLYTYSFTVVALLLAAGALGAALGLWAWISFVLTDLLVADRARIPAFAPYASYRGGSPLLHAWLPLILVYALLFGIVVLAPLLSRAFAVSAEASVRRIAPALALPAGGLLYLVVLGGLAYAWAQAVPFMIRPLWSFSGGVPETAAVQPIQGHTTALAAVAVAVGVVRLGLTAAGRSRRLARPRPPYPRPLTATEPWHRVVVLAGVTLQALVVTLLLGGLMANAALGVLCWIIVTAILVARVELVPRAPVWPDAVRHVPLLIRIGVCLLTTCLMTSVVVEPAVKKAETSFSPLLIAVLASLVVAALLLPGRPPGARQAGTTTDGHDRTPTATPREPSPDRPADPGTLRAALTIGGLLAAALVLDAPPAFADNCGGLTDCSVGVKVALVAAAIALVVLVVVLAPEVIAGAAAVESEIGAEIAGEEILGEAMTETIGEEAVSETAAEEASGAASASGPGQWESVSESMSPRAAEYQAQVTGAPTGQGYVVDGVKFDGFTDEGLIDAKGPGYARFVRDGEFRDWWQGGDKMVHQAISQLRAAGATPITWHVAEPEALTAIEDLFVENGISGIRLVLTPPVVP